MNRLDDLRALAAREGLDALLLTSPVARRYATGFASSAGMALVTPRAGYFFTDFRYIEAARAQVTGYQVEMTDRAHPYKDLVGALLTGLGVGKLGYEQDTMTAGQLDGLRAAWPSVTFTPAQKAMDALRQVKTEEEIARMEAAQRVSEAAFEALLPKLRPGLTESRVRAEFIYQMFLAGAENVSFDPIVVSGPNSSRPHGEAGDRALQAGDFLTLDFGVVYRGYCSDTTRTLAIGTPTEEMRRVYQVVLAAQGAGIVAARAGVTGASIHQAAADVIAAAGYGDYFGHGFGHGLGLEVHETGGAAPQAEEPLPAGMVLSAEPGIYLPGRFGVRIEDVIVLTAEGNRNLTALPKDLLVI
ncbi:MAG: Xaa-Pro peptidase family protein [Oscillospiraceae bacterium]|jgi:Xaa-Pro aminopeptidase|nr:Xaa-Pro peptidase family protein [Oscillospiraceae bacterium]